jgi:hypothetical protein
MMPHEKEDLQKHTLHLFTGDFKRLNEMYPKASASAIVRKLVHAHLSKIDKPINTDKIKVEDF